MNIYVMWFISVNISNESKIALINTYNNEENIYNNINDISNLYILKGKEYIRLKSTPLNKGYELLHNLKNNDIKFVTINSLEYPGKLKEIESPPYVIFYKGNIELFQFDMVAIVGSRRSTTQGNEITRQIAREITKMDIGIISGVAYGIDTVAHWECLSNSGKTIGVLGCGIDVVYPKVNKRLYEEIIKSGLLISEFIPTTAPLQYNFPMRNRIISGLSNKVIVVEASFKSGSLITANYALDQGKEVMAVPGSVLSENSRGCNKLIRDGAVPFTEIDDLYTFFDKIKKNTENMEHNNIKSMLLKVISNEPIHLDKIISNVNVDRVALFELLFEMQNRNEIICLPGNYYAKLS